MPIPMSRLVTRLLEREFKLAPLPGGFYFAGFDRRECGLDAERLQEPHDLNPDSLVDAQAAERDAAIAAMVQGAALAMVAAGFAVRTSIGDMQLAAAMPAAQQTRQQCLAAADRPARHKTLAVSVIGDQALIPFELRPTEIAFMMVFEQDVPFGSLALEAADNALAAGFDCHPATRSAERIGAAINGVCQDVVNGVVDGQLPDNAAAVRDRIIYGRQRNPLLAEPEMNLPDALELREF